MNSLKSYLAEAHSGELFSAMARPASEECWYQYQKLNTHTEANTLVNTLTGDVLCRWPEGLPELMCIFSDKHDCTVLMNRPGEDRPCLIVNGTVCLCGSAAPGKSLHPVSADGSCWAAGEQVFNVDTAPLGLTVGQKKMFRDMYTRPGELGLIGPDDIKDTQHGIFKIQH